MRVGHIVARGRKARLAHTPAMRCDTRLYRSGLWVKRAASEEGERLSSLEQVSTCYHQMSEGGFDANPASQHAV